MYLKLNLTFFKKQKRVYRDRNEPVVVHREQVKRI